MRVTIIGAGNMGRAIGMRALAGGHDVELIDHNPDKAASIAEELQSGAQDGASVETPDPGGAITGEVVVLAVYYGALQKAIGQYGDQLGGKVVVDISNPIDFEGFDGLAIPADTSAAEEVATLVPDDAKIVKAFNTTFAGTVAAGEVAGQPLDVLIAGDDDEAKRTVASLAEDGGLRAIDVGPLRRARQLEQLGFLHVVLQDKLGTGYGSTVKLLA
ncbi:MAG: NADPH-dependent F420 reductase [Actinobacteria bacterium]|nr:NADPH-dependent F420 reductase [Actinomycetota bacterium]